MYKFKGEPNQLVRITKVQKHLIRKVPKSIRFDKEGVFETENVYIAKRLSVKFEEIVEEVIIEEVVEEIEVDYNDLNYKELQNLYMKKTGNSAIGVKKVDIIKELEV